MTDRKHPVIAAAPLIISGSFLVAVVVVGVVLVGHGLSLLVPERPPERWPHLERKTVQSISLVPRPKYSYRTISGSVVITNPAVFADWFAALDSSTHRFDHFNAKYNPFGNAELRTIFLKSELMMIEYRNR